MSWMVAAVGGLIGIALVFVALSFLFDRSKQGAKIFSVSFALLTLLVTVQTIKLIASDNAGAGIVAQLGTLTTGMLILITTAILFYVSYFLITYLKGLLQAVKDHKNEKEELSWQVSN